MNPLVRLGELGQSPWYDYITRELIASGELARLIREDGLRGMTSNPTIFEKAVAGSRLLRRRHPPPRPRGAESGGDLRGAGGRGRARGLRRVRRPAPRHRWPRRAGLARGVARAGERHRGDDRRGGAAVGGGGPPQRHDQDPRHRGRPSGHHPLHRRRDQRQRHAAVLGGALRGGDRGVARRDGAAARSRPAARAGRVGGELLREPGGRQGGRAARPRRRERAVAAAGPDRHRQRRAPRTACSSGRSARRGGTGSPRPGARPQRPLWASTSTKDPRYPDTYYVEALVAPRTVNTLPPETFAAYRDHGRPAVRIRDAIGKAPAQMKALAAAGHRSRRDHPRAGGGRRREVRRVVPVAALRDRGQGGRAGRPLTDVARASKALAHPLDLRRHGGRDPGRLVRQRPARPRLRRRSSSRSPRSSSG